jgi:hypothetical protein
MKLEQQLLVHKLLVEISGSYLQMFALTKSVPSSDSFKNINFEEEEP